MKVFRALFCLLFTLPLISFAQNEAGTTINPTTSTATTSPVASPTPGTVTKPLVDSDQNIAKADPDNAVLERIKKEQKISPHSFAIAFHRPTYILPYYYTGSPYNSIYSGQTPQGESLKHGEVKYQFSFKVPVWKNIFNYPSTIYLAYTQLSYWQAYNKEAFFRETDYEPELFIANALNFHLYHDWYLNFVNFSLDHQSNGFGGTLERSWNRGIGSIIFSSDNWIVNIRPWFIFHDATYERQNPNMANYMGYGTVLLGYKFKKQLITLEMRNIIESGGKRSGNTVTWSFPVTDYLKGYVQVFSGYGQSLIEYDHRTNSIGIGVALSDWV